MMESAVGLTWLLELLIGRGEPSEADDKFQIWLLEGTRDDK